MSTQDNPIILETTNNKGIMTLNRPKSLNAINYFMMETIVKMLQEWENEVQCIILRGSGDKAFSAGGDVVTFSSQSVTFKDKKIIMMKEYTMPFAVAQCKVPVVALIDGITMGAGAGLAANATYRIATERTLFAMPEVALGVLPDVSGTYFLSRLEGKLGLYLALTCEQLKGKDVVKVGYATHYIESKDMPKLYEALITENNVQKVINEFTQDLSSYTFSLANEMPLINSVFSAPTVEEIIRRLEREGSEFSLKTLEKLNKMSPFAMKVCKIALDKGEKMTVKECLQMEFRINSAILEGTISRDYAEGVRALLKDKDRNPRWNPATLEEVSDEMVQRVFRPLPPEEEFTCKL